MQTQQWMLSRRRRKIGGVTLTELMIVVMILGILGAVAIPAYRGYSERAHRTYAKEALLSLRTNQERWKLQNNTYTADLTALGFPAGCTDYCVYTIDFTVAPDTQTYTARAQPTVGGGTNGVDQNTDGDCSWFTIDANGVTNAESANCW